MSDLPTGAVLLLQALLLFVSATCSSAESAAFSIGAEDRARVLQRGGAASRLLRRFARAPERFLLALLLLNLLINLSFFTVAAAWSLALHGSLGAAASAASFAAMLVCGDIVPKAFAVRHPPLLLRVVAPVMDPLVLATMPLVRPLTFLTEVLTGALTPSRDPPRLEPDEFRQLIRHSAGRGSISPTEREILERVLQFADLRARDAMEPRVRIAAVDLERPRAEAEATVRATLRSKLPAFRRSIDDVVGYVEGKDLFLRPDVPLEDLVQPIRFLSESTRLDATLQLMRSGGTSIAIALDEYGGTAGVLTVEGISSVLFGGLPDEHQEAHGFYRRRADGAWLVRGNCPIPVFNRLDDLGEPLPHGRAATLAGYVAAALDRIPRVGDEIARGVLRIRVLRVANGAATLLLASRDGVAEVRA